MPKFKVQNTDILYNKELYKEGSVIELNEDEAKTLSDYLVPEQEIKKSTKKENVQKTPETVITPEPPQTEVITDGKAV